jgi:O-antigen/teichoic acid export membrane protein
VTKAKAASAGLWSAIDIVLRQGVQFVVTIILARLLSPADFGVIALLVFFSSLSMVIVQGGLSMALVQRQQTSVEEESAAFWWNLLASLGFAAVIVLIAPAVARFYGQPVLQPLMLIAAAQVVVGALGTVQQALLSRTLRFADLAKVGAFATVLSGAAGVAAAYLGYGVWALAIQLISSTILSTGALWLVSDWRPVLHFRLSTIRPIIGFGAWLSLSSTLEVLYSQGFALLVGKLHGVRDLGFYSRAASTQQLPTNVLSSIIGRVALPLFATRSDDREALRRGLRTALQLVMLVNLPLMTGLALLPDLVIVALFGEKWLPAAPILAILAWSGVIFPMHVLNLQLILAQGRSRTYLQVELVKKAGGIVFVVVGSFFGIMGLAMAQLLFSFVALAINIAPVGRSIGYGLIDQIRDLLGLVGVTAFMAVVVVLARQMLVAPPLPALLILTAIGAVTFFAVGLLFRVEAMREGMDLAKPLLLRRTAGNS